jgi:stage II sporulation protein D
MKTKIIGICGAILMAGCTGPSTFRSVPENANIPQVKVLIQKTSQTVAVSATTAFAVKNADNQQDITFVSADQKIQLKRTQDKVEILDAQQKSLGTFQKIWIVAKSADNRFSVGGNSYRGSLNGWIEGDQILVVNNLDMESYVMGVVKNEIGNLTSDQLDAAKAQAVAARTYAVRSKNKNTKQDYYFASDVSDQVYQGASSESDLTNRAVLETLGEIAIYEGKPINAVYFSTCGGITANAEDVWKGTPHTPYLVRVSTHIGDTVLCAASPHYRWELKWTGEELSKLIKANLPAVLKNDLPNENFAKLDSQKLYNIAVIKRDSSQRVQELSIGFTKDSYVVSGEQARRVLKGDKYILYSSLFRMDVTRNTDSTIQTVLCKGAGYGHGVGLCQYSAREMAKMGYTYKQILQFFYRGTSTQKMW